MGNTAYYVLYGQRHSYPVQICFLSIFYQIDNFLGGSINLLENIRNMDSVTNNYATSFND